MATESPMRLVESAGARNWPSSKEAATFASSSNNMAAEELGLLLKGQRFHGNGRDVIPNRSGSAPPSMEGSFAAIGNLIASNCSLDGSLAGLNSALENCESEEQLRADPAYLAYYCSNVNLNPRLPPPLVSRENRRLVRHIGGLGNNWMTSFDDSGNGSILLSRGTLSTHKEEPEDDRSPRQASGDWAEGSSGLFSEQWTSSLTGRHKSLVDLIQEDFPRTPSPVYNQCRSSSHVATEEGVDHDAIVTSIHDPPNNSAKLTELNLGSAGISVGTISLGVHSVGSISSGDSSAPILSSSSPDGMGSHPEQKGGSSSLDINLEDDVLITSMTDPDITSIKSEIKAIDLSSLPNAENHRNQQEWQHPQPNNSQQHHLRSQQGTTSQVQGHQSQMISHGMHRQYIGSDQYSLGHSKFSAVEVQPALQSSGITPPLYATATAYMTSGNPFYPNLQLPGLFAPQYGLGGYALNTSLLPPFVAGYPPHSAIPMAFDGSAGPSFSARPTGVSTGGSIAPGVDLQHLFKFYGQLGFALQPSFPDPLYMQYIQHSSDDAYASGQYNPLASRVMRSQVDGFDSQKASSAAAYPADQKSQYPRGGGLTIPSSRKGGVSSPNLYGSPPGMGVLMQFPTSPLASTVITGSPMGGTSLPGRRNEMRSPPGSSRNPGVYSGWQGQRGTERFDDPKTSSFLEELKSSKARRFELSDIAGRIVEFSSDQHGSRFIQQKLETCSVEEKASVFKEILPHASKLMTDVFGNYVIQKFFEHGSPEQRKELANQLTGHMLPLSLQMYGCRVIQKALEVIELDQKTKLVHELDGHIMRCVRDQNGNHVIQKCIECVPTEKIGFIISAFHGQVATLSTHPYGCRVIQRVLEHCTDDLQCQCIVDEILESASALAQDQYGNYVTQAMMKDQFANYVVQKILETCTDKKREGLLNRITDHLHALKKYTYGKHIVARFEQLYGEEIHASET
ncbi:pumilio homolog 5-like isoform X2 [Telopea speciosissima]|uniref:pumilio homolog 5-like isoform X2 n=1 Tax=Telopea speciosissima TaxID=54955 RepID=UPI001CC52D5D|nr:pumilio homolog 5-like isoform X2 [Telopea speciosissima]